MRWLQEKKYSKGRSLAGSKINKIEVVIPHVLIQNCCIDSSIFIIITLSLSFIHALSCNLDRDNPPEIARVG